MSKPQAASMYESAKKIYPREIDGRFEKLSRLATISLLGLFYGVAWLQWNGRQAFLFDLPERKFYLLGMTLWPQDFPYLALLLIIAALTLFFFTALAGRLWCGFACPQTVWTEIFIWMEQLTEGTRSQRMKLDKAPWSWNKFRRKASKQFLWITFSLWTGFTFVGYFTPIRELGLDVLALNVGGWTLFWGLFYGFATYGNAGYMREQVCPTGIDIRDGLQYECIACAACIDACDSVMDRMNYPRGLVRYTTENALHNKETHVVRPRMLVYAALLLILIGGLVTSMVTRTPIILDVIRDRNGLYRELPADLIENTYTIKLINQRNEKRQFRLEVTGVDGIYLDGVDEVLLVEGGGVLNLPVRARAHRDNAEGIRKTDFIATALDNETQFVIEDSRFLGPSR